MAYVIPIFVAFVQSLLHKNNIGVTYVRISNFIMEPITFVPLHFVAMSRSIITVTKIPFVSTLVNIVVGIKSKPQTPKGT
jgi:hypothetical protein